MAKTESLSLSVCGRAIPVTLRRQPRARRMLLKLDRRGDGVVLVLPPGVPLCTGLKFARSREAWIVNALSGLPPRIPFEEGARLPVDGREVRLTHDGRAKGGAWLDGERLMVSGKPEFMARRVADFLKELARRRLLSAAHAYAARLGVRIEKIQIRDPQTRWGSCSSRGVASFSWRLILAPPEVLSYVAAHEAAHLLEMNHSAAFWAHVERAMPDYRPARSWLKRYGAGLHRYG